MAEVDTSLRRTAGRPLSLDGTTPMEPLYKIVCARPQDLHLLPAIELAAAALLKGHAPESVLCETTNNADQEYLTKNLPYFTAIFFYAGVLRDFVRVWLLSRAGRVDN